MRKFSSKTRRQVGFTLIEILIVVVILGIMAMIVVPQFSNASKEARENTLKDDLRYLRTQIQVYRAQHRDANPGSNGSFVDQMTMFTSESGATNATYSSTYKFGPYLSRMPTNPIAEKDTITLAGAGETPASKVTNTTGWIYKPTTGDLIADSTGSDGNGVAYTQY